MRILAALGLMTLLYMAEPGESTVFVGTYTRQNSKGIYAYRFNSASGALTPIGLAAETSNPSFLAAHPNGGFLYAVNEDNAGAISAFSIQPGGRLSFINKVSSRGSGPCHIAFDRTGNYLFVANYNSGVIAGFPVMKDGRLLEASAVVQHSGSSVNRQRQAGPHAHSVNVSPDNRFLIVNDLGLDKTLVYRFDEKTGALTANSTPHWESRPGSGPRHMEFSPDGKFAWVLAEMTAAVTALTYNASAGTFTELQTIAALPGDFTGLKSGAEIAAHPNGRFLYTSNRGHDSIAVFEIEAGTGRLKPGAWVSTRGRTPRHFAIDPTGGYLLAANQDSSNVTVLRIDSKTGGLSAVGPLVDAPVPVSIVFAKADK